MGGGSADAAATLIALDRLWGLQLGGEQLRALGARLGADVPFAMLGHTALGRGNGGELTTVLTHGDWTWLLAVPGGPLSTPAVRRRRTPSRSATGDRCATAPGAQQRQRRTARQHLAQRPAVRGLRAPPRPRARGGGRGTRRGARRDRLRLRTDGRRPRAGPGSRRIHRLGSAGRRPGRRLLRGTRLSAGGQHPRGELRAPAARRDRPLAGASSRRLPTPCGCTIVIDLIG